MKELIRSILKEEVNQTNNPKFNKLMKIFVSAMKSEFPFIEGWVAKDDPDDPDTGSVSVELIVNSDKAKEFYGLPYGDWYDDDKFRKQILKDKSERGWAYPFSLLKLDNNQDKWEFYQPFYEYAKLIYREIPDELKPTYKYHSIVYDDPVEVTKDLDLDTFLIKE